MRSCRSAKLVVPFSWISAVEAISVRVETRTLSALPSLSWQEQLPPLNVPLTAIIPPNRPRPGDDDEVQQQQQQQQ